jgi:hypothetical protein
MKLNPQQLTLLDQIEAHLAQFSVALLINQTDEMMRVSSVLQSLVVGLSRSIFSAALKPGRDPSLQQRLKKLATSLASQRESLLRHSVMTERALSSLMPAARSDTYVAPVAGVVGGYGKRVFGAYGGAGRRSGEFQMSAA